MNQAHAVVLRAGRERPVQQRHPWIFSGAIAHTSGSPEAGALVDVYAADQTWLARGTWSSTSQIRVRLFCWDAAEDAAHWLAPRLERAIAARRALPHAAESNATRLVYAESDGLPGLIVDQYDRYLVVQLLTQGMAARAAELTSLLAELLHPLGIYERSDADVRQKEGLPAAEGPLWGDTPPQPLEIQQPPLRAGAAAPRFLVDVQQGHKTGFYLDQARNRVRVAAYCADQEVLDCFCYTGGFTLYAACAGAQQITAIDSSAPALEQLRANLARNQQATPVATDVGDLFQLLRHYRSAGRQFDLIILDPPKFAHHQGQVERATRGYKDINLLALHLLRPGGILVTYSCSGLIAADLFQKIIFGAALDARRDVQIIERLTQAPDHPILLTFPEGAYLKGLICRVW